MLDMFCKFDTDKKVNYVWFNTGLEYQATKNHLEYLETKYDIKIHRENAIKPIPLAVKEYGVPLFNKNFSEMLSRLQKHNFNFQIDGNKSYEELIVQYPTCKSALAWWCNKNKVGGQFNINNKPLLKEFIIRNPPSFKISNKCCKYAKKDVAKQFNKNNKIDLNVVGVRKSEGGIRAISYKNCFTSYDDKYDEYRPLFFFTDDDKQYYKNYFNISYSDCYELWGMKRTGCVGCPYGRNVQQELMLCQQYEPKLYKAVMNIFGQSYEYEQRYKSFKQTHRNII